MKTLSQFKIALSILELSFAFIFFVYFYSNMFYFTIFTVLTGALMGAMMYRVVLPPVDKTIAKQVIYGTSDIMKPIFGHRGASYEAPENTIAAIKQAKLNGAIGVEIDVAFTKDDVAVLFHDNTLDRTTNGTGCLSDLLFEELMTLDASHNHPFGDKYRGEKIPKLEEAVATTLQLGMKIIFDLKDYDERSISAILDMYSKFPELYEHGLVASFYHNLIYQIRKADPKIVTALTWRPHVIGYDSIPNGNPRNKSKIAQAFANFADILLDWAFHHLTWYVTGASAVLVHKDVVSSEYSRTWKEKGVEVLVWTPNYHREKEFLLEIVKVPIITDTILS